jgi:protein SCO1/2
MKLTLFLPCLLLALAGCKPAAPAPAAGAPKTYPVRGIVQSVEPDQHRLTVKHEAIPGYMAAMTMPFTVRDTNELAGVAAGDDIAFTLAVTETDDWIEHLQRLGKTNTFGLSGPPGWHAVEPALAAGDPLPDYEFTGENGQPVRFSDFRGRAVAFTFFFTRCPLPEYCPRLNRHFQEARQILIAATNGPANWELLCISFDAEFDTPQMLSNYAKLYRGNDARNWLFAAAATNTLARLAPKVDLNYWHDGGSISHNLRTVVLDPNGKIFRQFDGNDWTPEQLADAVKAAAQVK